MKSTLALPIPAEVHTSDYAKYAEFDANEWFAQAPAEAIIELARSGWCFAYRRPEVVCAIRKLRRVA
jgi:hypothetical protein